MFGSSLNIKLFFCTFKEKRVYWSTQNEKCMWKIYVLNVAAFRAVYATATTWTELEPWLCFLQTLLASLRTPALKSGNLALANDKHMLVLLIKHIYNARVPSLLNCVMVGAHADLECFKCTLNLAQTPSQLLFLLFTEPNQKTKKHWQRDSEHSQLQAWSRQDRRGAGQDKLPDWSQWANVSSSSCWFSPWTWIWTGIITQ